MDGKMLARLGAVVFVAVAVTVAPASRVKTRPCATTGSAE